MRKIRAAPIPAPSPNSEPKKTPTTATVATSPIEMTTESIIAARILINKPLKGLGCVSAKEEMFIISLTYNNSI